MTHDPGHNYSFGSPSKGWPDFGPDGKIVRETYNAGVDLGFEVCRSPVANAARECVKNCGASCQWGQKP